MRIARAVPGLVAALVLLGAFACGRGAPAESLLAGKLPARADGVANPALLTDGRQASEGATGTPPAAAILQVDRAFVDYDLGKSVPIDAAYLQGDNNDDYVVAVSEDGNRLPRAVGRAPGRRPRVCAGGRPTAWAGRGAGSGCPRAAATASTR